MRLEALQVRTAPQQRGPQDLVAIHVGDLRVRLRTHERPDAAQAALQNQGPSLLAPAPKHCRMEGWTEPSTRRKPLTTFQSNPLRVRCQSTAPCLL